MKKNGDIIRPDEVSRISYGQIKGDEYELNGLIGSDEDDSGDEAFNEQYAAIQLGGRKQ